jgi:hypothetical protein
MHWRVRGKHGLLESDALRRIACLHGGELRLQTGRDFQPFQSKLVPPLQHINISTNTHPGSQESILTVQRIKGSNRGMNTFQSHPKTCPDSHEHIIQRGTDIQDRRGLQQQRAATPSEGYPPLK